VFPLTANAVRLGWVRLCKRAGISDLHFHDLRHEAISRFFEAGLSTAEVALISGHPILIPFASESLPSSHKMDPHTSPCWRDAIPNTFGYLGS
jgi:hypothetical protein